MTFDPVSESHTFSVDVKNREIYLHGYIQEEEDGDSGVDYRMAVTFIKNIRILENINEQPIVIHMHSIGGRWNDGMAIYDAIKTSKSHITIIVYGQAESMSGIILQSADKRVMMPNSYFMLHFGSFSYEGSSLSVINYVDFEKRNLNTMLDIYTESMVKSKFYKDRMGGSKSKVKAFIRQKLKNGDWCLSAEEAVYYGLADSMVGVRRSAR